MAKLKKRPYLLLAGSAALLLLTLWLAVRVARRAPQPVALTPSLTGQTEYCLTCHGDLPEISPSHPVEVFGCVICHGGERLALDADLAHSTLRGGANPSDLAVVEASCGGGDCHSGAAGDERNHIQRVQTSVQATYAGAIASIRFTFGAQPDLSAYYGTRAVVDEETQTGITDLLAFDPSESDSSAIQSFGANCLNCHLNAPAAAGRGRARFTGCAACHTPVPSSLNSVADENRPPIHKLTTAISYAQCNTCHNRGNYDLRAMTFVPRNDQPASRLETYYQPIAQFTRCEYTLDCIDCHTREEAMGDGDIHASESDMQYIQCKTCHGTPTELPRTKTLTDPDDLAFRLAGLNPVVDLKLGDQILVTEKGEPLWNTRVLPDGTYELIGKVTRLRFTFRPVMGSGCEQSGDDQSSAYCHQCHMVEK